MMVEKKGTFLFCMILVGYLPRPCFLFIPRYVERSFIFLQLESFLKKVHFVLHDSRWVPRPFFFSFIPRYVERSFIFLQLESFSERSYASKTRGAHLRKKNVLQLSRSTRH